MRPSRGLPRAWFPTEPKRGGGVFGVHTRHPPAAANTAPHPRNFPSPTGQRRKTATTLSLHPEARKQPPLAPRQCYQRAGGPILRATRDVSPPARAGSPGGINRMSARPGRVDENLVCAPGEGAVSLPRSPPGLGPRPRALPAASTLRSPGNPPPAHLRRPGPSVQRPRSRAARGTRRARTDSRGRASRRRQGPAPLAPSAAAAGFPTSPRRHSPLPCAPGPGGSGSPRGSDRRPCWLRGQPRGAPACARPGADEGAPRGRSWLGRRPRALSGSWVLGGRRGLRWATRPPPTPPRGCLASPPRGRLRPPRDVPSGSPGKGGGDRGGCGTADAPDQALQPPSHARIRLRSRPRLYLGGCYGVFYKHRPRG